MCWTSRKVPVKTIAEHDITVYKVFKYYNFNIMPTSVFMGFVYNFDKEYTTEIGEVNIRYDFYTIEEGFHSYININLAYNLQKMVFSRCLQGSLVKRCVIPKGSEYYENENGEIVSNKIILRKSDENTL